MPKQRRKALRFQLLKIMRNRCAARFSTRFEVGRVRGYVLDVGPEFFLLALVSDGIRFNGFECFRVSDVRNFKPDPYSAFAEAALKKRGLRRPKKPRVSVSSVDRLLVSAARAFPLVTIERESIDPNVCWIGRVLRVKRGRVSILEIGAGAKWDKAATEYRLKEITRVSFGGDYEDALYLVGGEPELNKPLQTLS